MPNFAFRPEEEVGGGICPRDKETMAAHFVASILIAKLDEEWTDRLRGRCDGDVTEARKCNFARHEFLSQ